MRYNPQTATLQSRSNTTIYRKSLLQFHRSNSFSGEGCSLHCRDTGNGANFNNANVRERSPDLCTKFTRNPHSKKMFRQTARFTARVASSHQRRAYSSQNSQRTVTSSNFAKAVGGGILLFVAFKPTESHNAGLFSSSSASVDLKKVRADLAAAIEVEDAKRGDGTSIAPTLVRLAWHASGTYSIFDKTGGSNGATMRFKPDAEWGANAGLKVARDFVDGIVKKHPGLSVADAWTLAGGMQNFLFYCAYFSFVNCALFGR